MRTGFASVRLGFAMYVVPFIMVYRAPFLLNGSLVDICLTFIISFLAIGVIAVAVIGFFKNPLNWVFRPVLILAAGMLLFGNIVVQFGGILVIGAIAITNSKDRKLIRT